MTHSWIMGAARAFTITLLPIALLSTVHAGDAAARKVIGFSPDGVNFAFEQYAQLYHSTEIMTQVQVLEKQTDGSVKFTIFTTLNGGGDDSDMDGERAAIAAKAKPLLDRLGIAEAGTRLAGQPSMNLDTVGIYPMDSLPLANRQAVALPDGRKLTLTLSDHALGEASCKGVGGRGIDGNVTVTGAVLQGSIDGAPSVTLANDKELPYDRRCVTGYGIAEVHHHQTADGTQTLAVLLETVDANGFRAGPNRRFMAVTARLPKL